MNLSKVLDVDGCGLINSLVLQRSLHKFDSAVFTEENLRALLSAIPIDSDVHGEEAVNIKAFVDMVGVSSPKLQRPKSAEVRSASLHAYMDGLQFDVGGFREVLDTEPSSSTPVDFFDGAEPSAGSAPEGVKTSEHELALVKEDLKKKAKDYVLDVQRRNVLPLWEAFDGGKKGALALADCEKLVAAYLSELVPRSAELVRATVELGLELSVVLFERRNADPSAREHMRAQAKLQSDALVAKVAPLVREMLEKMAAEDPRALAVDLMDCLGSDSQGTVNREAFEAHFVEAMRHVLGPERMVERLQCLGSQASGVGALAAAAAHP